MLAVWYERQGPAHEVLQVGERPAPEPAPSEVRVRLALSGVNPGDTKKRGGIAGSLMPYPLVIPHSDGTGVIDAVGAGVDAARVGERVWVHGAQSYRPFGTAAEWTAVPADLAVPLPAAVSDEVGASLGIPGITAHRAVFADGPVQGRTVLVQGVLGGVSSIAAHLALAAGANLVSTVRRTSDLDAVPERLRATAVALDVADPAAAIRDRAPDGVDRVIEVAFSANIDLDAQVVANDAVIAAYGTRDPRPPIPFLPMLFANVVVRLLGSDDFPAEAKRAAAADLTRAAEHGDLDFAPPTVLPLERAADAHDLVDAGSRGRVLLRLPGSSS